MKKGALLLFSIVSVLACAVFLLSHFPLRHASAAIQKEVTTIVKRPSPVVPSGNETYQILQKDSPGPHITQATIDPPDVHVGDVQKFVVIVKSVAELDSVKALIETDHGTTTVDLKLAGIAKASDVLPMKYALNDKGVIMPISELASNVAPSGESGGFFDRLVQYFFGRTKTTSAATIIEPAKEYRYEGSWTVRDTHNIYYHTTFIARDVNGQEDSAQFAWSDACGIPQGGNWTISGNCTLSSLDGVDNGTTTITNYTLTLNPGVQFVFTPGKPIIIGSGGSIVIGAGASLVKGYLYYTDADSDGYPASATITYSALSSWAGHTLRGSETNYATIDCNDTTASFYQNLTGYTDGDGDGYGAVGSNVQVCSGATLASGYVANGNDCDDTNSLIKPGSTRTRYAALAVTCGTAAGSETQTCQPTGGVWNGTYTLTSPATASSRTRYAALTSSCGTYGSTNENQTCQTNGLWSGTYSLTSAPSAATGSGYNSGSGTCGTYCSYTGSGNTCTSSGWSLATSCSASTRTMYGYQSASPCGIYATLSENQTCTSGGWTGSYTSAVPYSISTSIGYVTQQSSGCGSWCSIGTQYCQSNGQYSPLESSCTTSLRTRYGALTSACGTYGSGSEVQGCQSDGTWYDPLGYTLLSPPAASQQTMYASACAASCTSQVQTCQSNGAWTGTYAYASCSIGTPTTYYRDADGDGHGAAGNTTSACGGAPIGYVSSSNDCNDADAQVYGGNAGWYTDAVDHNCDGFVTKDVATYVSGCTINNGTAACNYVPPGPCAAATCNPNTAIATPACGSTYTPVTGCNATAYCAKGSCVPPISYNCPSGSLTTVHCQ